MLIRYGHKKRVSLLHRTATTRYRCFDQDLAGFPGSWSCRTYPAAKVETFSGPCKLFAKNITVFLRILLLYQKSHSITKEIQLRAKSNKSLLLLTLHCTYIVSSTCWGRLFLGGCGAGTHRCHNLAFAHADVVDEGARCRTYV